MTQGSEQTERWDVASSGDDASTRTTSEGADKPQAAAGASGVRTATAAASVTDIAHSIAVTLAVAVTTTRYGFSGDGDTPDITMEAVGSAVAARLWWRQHLERPIVRRRDHDTSCSLLLAWS